MKEQESQQQQSEHTFKYSQQTKNNKLKTPEQLSFLQYYMIPQGDQFQYVYRPGDDSFLMLSVLKQEIKQFSQNLSICEIGSGSGILSAHLNKWLTEQNKKPYIHVATDISLDACLLSQRYFEQYNLEIEILCTSFVKGLRIQPEIMLCNPPYVPTDPEQKQSQLKYLQEKLRYLREGGDISKRSPSRNLIAYSYMGGPQGLDTTRLLINSIHWKTKLYLIVMGQEGLETLSHEVKAHKIIHPKIISVKLSLLQKFKKMNEELYVILIEFIR